MKKIIYLCAMMLLCLNMMAQIDLSQGWSLVLNEQFVGSGRSWDSTYYEKRPTGIPADSNWKCLWRVDLPEIIDGVTRSNNFNHQAYQRSNTLFNNGVLNDNKMRLVAEYISDDTLVCDGIRPIGYEIPKGTGHHCDTTKQNIHYYSGNIQSRYQSYEYGYYEIECALPIHKGIHTSFWLYGERNMASAHYYEEIDIMEYSHTDWDGDEHRGYSSGVWYKENDVGDTLHLTQNDHYGYKNIHMPETDPDISQMHTYGCEWMPDYIIFYRDGQITHEFHDKLHIPQYPKYIKTGYSIDYRALASNWFGPDTLTINNIKVYKLNTDCETDELVQNVQQLNQIDTMKQSITISNTNGITLPSTTNKILRASDYILIDEPFEIATGAQLTLMVHECPNYSNNYPNMSTP